MPEGTAIWALADGKAGNRSQAFGVADALGQPYREICIDDGPLGILPNILLGASLTGIDASSRNMLTPPWPDLVIAAGRRTAPVARWIKHRAGGKTKLCQIMDPGAGRSDFDLIAWPAHDRPANAANVMAIKAAPHRITPARLAAARVEWAGAVDELPMPRIAVLVGGSTRRRRFTDAMARELGEMTNAAADAGGGSLMLTTSRRTGAAVDALAGMLRVPHRLFRWDSGEENPYLGFLAAANVVVVTGESVSMCSEACATGKPVYIFAPDGLITDKHARQHQALIEGGHARLFAGTLGPFDALPLATAPEIAGEIRRRGLIKI